MKPLIYFFFVARVLSQEVTTPASQLGPKYFNHHAFEAEQFLKSLNLPVPTQKGPVLFPNDGPPRPRPPLVVTSRPLLESIARSNLNPDPVNNSIAQSSNNGVSFVPYIGGAKNYLINYGNNGPYVVTDRYHYETQTTLPPIYKVVNQAKPIANPDQRLLNYDYQIKEPVYTHQRHNEVHDENSADYGNYAFSYTVKDKNTGDDFSHSQQSKGSATNGEYRVRLPDGRMQIVSYTADENGYKADVRYDDVAYVSDNVHNNIDYENKPQYVDKVDKHAKDYDYKNNVQPKDYKQDYYNYDTKDYYNDYSSEYNENYLPHTNKFSNLIKPVVGIPTVSTIKPIQNAVSTVKPSYNDIKHLFTPNKFYNPIESSTPKNDYVATTDNVVLISAKPNLYTNINVPKSTALPIVATTPRSYLISTIASLKNKLNLNPPVLSGRFIDKINKYLKFN